MMPMIDNYSTVPTTMRIKTNGTIEYYAIANKAMQVNFSVTYIV